MQMNFRVCLKEEMVYRTMFLHDIDITQAYFCMRQSQPPYISPWLN